MSSDNVIIRCSCKKLKLSLIGSGLTLSTFGPDIFFISISFELTFPCKVEMPNPKHFFESKIKITMNLLSGDEWITVEVEERCRDRREEDGTSPQCSPPAATTGEGILR